MLCRKDSVINMVDLIKQIDSLGITTVVISFILALLALTGAKELIAKVKKNFGWVDIKDLERQDMLDRIANLEKEIKVVDQRVTDTSCMYDNKLEGYHQQSIKIRGDLANDIIDVKHTQDDIKTSILDLKHIVIDDKIDTIRWEILDFSSRLISAPNAKYNKEQFDHVFDIYEKYERILAENGLENGRVDMSMDFVKKKYTELMSNGFN